VIGLCNSILVRTATGTEHSSTHTIQFGGVPSRQTTLTKDTEMKRKSLSSFFVIAIVAIATTLNVSTHAQESSPPVELISFGEDGTEKIHTQKLETGEHTQGTLTRQSLGGFSAKIVWHVTPNPSGSIYPLYRENMMKGLELGTAFGTGASAFIPLTDGAVILPKDITITPYNLGGFQIEAGLVVRSSTKFHLADIPYRLESSDISVKKPLGELGFSGNFSTNNYSITRIGTDYGLDARPGTLDDISYTSGAGTIPENALVYRGIGNWFIEGSPANTGDVERYIAEKQPYTITAEYSIPGLGTIRSSIKVQSVTAPLRPTISFTTSAGTILTGSSATLSWNVQNDTTSVTLSGTGSVASTGSLVVTPNQTTTYTLVAVGPGGTTQQDVQVVVAQPPLKPVITFSSNVGSVLQGESVMLTWNVQNETSSITLSDRGSVVASGSRLVTPTKTTTYIITAIGPGGTEQKSVEVVVTEPPLKPAITFNSNVGSVVPGGSATLTWNIQNSTTSVNLSGTGSVATSGDLKVTPSQTTTYIITAIGPGGTVEQSVTVVVTATSLRPTATFTASASLVKFGEVVTLGWEVKNDITSVNLEGVGFMTKSGAYVIAPATTTTYTLTVVGPGGTTVEQVTVVVIQPPVKPKIASFTTSVSSITAGAGESVKLSWEVLNNPTSVTLSGIGSVATSGSFTVTPTQTTTYTLIAIGSGGTVQQDVQVFVTAPLPPPTLTFTSNVSSVTAGKPALLTWSTEHASLSVSFSDTGSVTSSGNRIVNPMVTTDYILTAMGPGGSLKQTVTIVVTMPPQEQLNLQFSTSITYEGSPGTAVEGKTITLKVIFSSSGTQGTGPLLSTWQVNTDGGAWIDWLKDGFTTNLAPGESFLSTLPFMAGKPDGKTYRYRLKVSSSTPDQFENPTVFSDATAALRVVAGQIKVSMMNLKRDNSVVGLTLTAPPGIYNIEEATSVTGPWTFKEEAIIGAQGVEIRTYLTTGQGRFFRARAR